jgi:hypothetical protein
VNISVLKNSQNQIIGFDDPRATAQNQAKTARAANTTPIVWKSKYTTTNAAIRDMYRPGQNPNITGRAAMRKAGAIKNEWDMGDYMEVEDDGSGEGSGEGASPSSSRTFNLNQLYGGSHGTMGPRIRAKRPASSSSTSSSTPNMFESAYTSGTSGGFGNA